MRSFDYSNLKNRTWDNEILSYIFRYGQELQQLSDETL